MDQAVGEVMCALGHKRMVPVLVLAILMGGCLDNPIFSRSADPLPFLVLDGAEPCDQRLVENCDEVEKSPDAAYHLRPIDLHMDDTRKLIADEAIEPSTVFDVPAALVVKNVERSVIISSFRSIGFRAGIHIEDIGCPTCTISISNADILEDNEYVNQTGEFLSQVIGIKGISIKDTNATIKVRDTSIYLREHQGVDPEEGFYAESIGIKATGLRGDIYIENVTIGAPGQTKGPGIQLDLHGTAKLSDLRISNYSGCILQNSGTFEIESVHLTDCWYGVTLGLIQTEGFTRGNLNLEKFLIERTDFGIYASRPPIVVLCPWHDQTLWEGVMDSQPPFAQISDGTIRDSKTAGFYAWEFSNEIRRVAFVDNGKGESETATGGIVSLCGSHVDVKESIIEGNEDWGAYARWFDDLSENWWGSPTGPNVNPTDLGPKIGDGDRTGGSVKFSPFLRERPDIYGHDS